MKPVVFLVISVLAIVFLSSTISTNTDIRTPAQELISTQSALIASDSGMLAASPMLLQSEVPNSSSAATVSIDNPPDLAQLQAEPDIDLIVQATLPGLTLLAPSNGATNIQTTKPTFDWSDVSGSSSYHIQIAETGTFTTPTVDHNNQGIGTYTKKLRVLEVVYRPTGVTQLYEPKTLTLQLQTLIENASKYHGYSNTAALRALDVQVVKHIERIGKRPTPGDGTWGPSYQAILDQDDLCSQIRNLDIDQVWLWMDARPTVDPAPGLEYVFSSPYFKISDGSGGMATPFCEGKKSFVMMGFDYSRDASHALHSFGHMFEDMLDSLMGRPLFWDNWAGLVPNSLLAHTCGSVHYPPNGMVDYDYTNETPVSTRCESWNPEGTGTLSTYTCTRWGCTQGGFLTWWFRNMPNLGNTFLYGGKKIPNWFDFVSHMDQTLHMYKNDQSWFLNRSFFTLKNGPPAELGSTFVPPLELPIWKKLYWRVQAENGASVSPWSVTYSFQINPEQLTPVPSSPANGSTTISSLRPTFSWNAIPNITGYAIQVSTVPTFASFVINQPTNSTQPQFEPSVDLPQARTLYWRVQAVAGTTRSPFSTVFSFFSPDPPNAPVGTSPVSNTILKTATPNLTWRAATSPDAASYTVQVSTKTGTAFESGIVDEKLSLSGSTLTYTTKPLTPGTVYYWRVRGISSASVIGPWSVPLSFKIALDSPNLLSPSSSSTAQSTRPIFDWSDVMGATHYVVQRSVDGVTFTTLSPLVTSSTYTPTADLLPKGSTLYWRVLSYSAVFGYSSPSQVRTLTLANPPSIPVPSLPANGALLPEYQTTLIWRASTGVGVASPHHYQVQVASDPAFTTIVDENINVALTPTTVVYQTKVLQATTKHYWRIRSVNSQGQYSLWSTPWSFTTKTRLPKLTSKTLAPASNNKTISFSQPYAGNDRLVVVAASYRTSSGNAGKISTITFGSVPLSFIRRDQYQEYVTELWYVPPAFAPTGITSGMVIVHFAGTTDSHQLTGLTFTDVDPNSPIRKDSNGTIRGVGNGADPTPYIGVGSGALTIPTSNTELPFTIHTTYTSANAVTLGTGQTVIRKTAFANSISSLSTKLGSVTTPFTWTTTKNWPWAASGISIVGK